MSTYNKVILLGNLTRDPELRHTPSGAAVCEVGLAINDRRKGPNGDTIEETTFVDVTLWTRLAEVAAQYLQKGAKVLIEGRLKLETWESDQGKRSKLKVIASGLQMLGSPGGQQGQQPRQSAPPQQHDQRPQAADTYDEDDIPF